MPGPSDAAALKPQMPGQPGDGQPGDPAVAMAPDAASGDAPSRGPEGSHEDADDSPALDEQGGSFSETLEMDASPAQGEMPGPDEALTSVALLDTDTEAIGADEAPVEPISEVPGVASAEGEWLDRICPYLLSEDGTWRSTQPDLAHRCMAQDPPGTLPTAFQERFCLTDRHVRCEMYKLAESNRSAALEGEGIPVDQVKEARFKPSVRSVPLALGATEGDDVAAAGERSPRRPLLIAAAAIGGVAIILILVVAFLGGGGLGGGAASSPTPSPAATTLTTPPPTARLTLPPPPPRSPQATPRDRSVTPEVTGFISYEIQEGEGLVMIANKFGVRRRDILDANEGMRDRDPYAVAGDVIRVPVGEGVSEEFIRADPGFQEFVE